MEKTGYPYDVDDKCVRLSYNVFVVKNQNGFNKAIYEWCKPSDGGDYGDGYNYSKEDLRNMVTDYPKSYPSVVVFGFVYEIMKIMVTVFGMGDISEILNCFKRFGRICGEM